MSEYETKDSGARAEFASGMVRDTEEGKARFDLLLPEGVPYDEQMLTRDAQLMGRGAVKYGDRNWERARGEAELKRYHSSAHRHLMQWIAGEFDEDHAAAVRFNVLAGETVKFKMRADASARLANELAQAAEQGASMFSKRHLCTRDPLGSGICRGECEPDKVYIAGPMSGLPEYNYPAFFAAARRFEEMGWQVFNPATNEHPEDLAEMNEDQARAYFMAIDIPMVLQSDAIAVLAGWQGSKGAQLEVAIGRMLGLRIMDASTMEDLP